MKLITGIRDTILYPLGIDIVKFPNGLLKKRIELLRKYDVDLVLDVGANKGQYSSLLRNIGYDKKIISFEPVKVAYDQLIKKSKKDVLWECHNYALGDSIGDAEINVASNLSSSSLLEMNDTHVQANPNSRYKSKEKIHIETLDSFFENNKPSEQNIFLKLDVQGFEKKVLEGAKNSLDRMIGIQLEMSFESLYKTESLFDSLKKTIEEMGFELCSIEPGGFSKKNGKLLQTDGIFFRTQKYGA